MSDNDFENETLNTDEWIEIAGVINKLGLDQDFMFDYYDKLDDDLYDDIRDLSDLYDCEDQNKKIDKLSELLPEWKTYHVSGRLEDVEERLKEKAKEEEESDSATNANINYDSWMSKKEKEDAQIDEMFGALRVFG